MHEEEASGQIKGMDELLYRQRHSAAHIMAEAVLTVFPEAKYAIGPPIENGFYYDFDLPRPLTPEDLQEIDRLMRESIAADKTFVRSTQSKEEARRFFAEQPYKLELIDGIPDPEVGICTHGNFTDLCGYPHVESTGKVGAFKLNCNGVAEQLRAAGLRIEVDARGERMQAKIRDAQLKKVPYMLVAGDREAEASAIAVRTRDAGDLGPMPVEALVERIRDEVASYGKQASPPA